MMTEESTLAALVREVAGILNAETVDPDLGLTELGVDSLNSVELVLVCDRIYPGANTEGLSIGQYTSLRELDRQLRQTSLAA
jgi:Phosphopantetheine attachment site